MNSFNHYAYGAVAEWMYRYVAGINPDEKCPGFKHILLNPNPDFRPTFLPEGQQRIKQAEASYDSYYGMIRSAWKIESNGSVKYDITIPANTTATLSLLLPNENSEISESGKSVDKTKGIVSVNRENGKAVIELVSGKYSFEVR
jgi:alpha-L-rhamnosidase